MMLINKLNLIELIAFHDPLLHHSIIPLFQLAYLLGIANSL
jgi:hypothetical protein